MFPSPGRAAQLGRGTATTGGMASAPSSARTNTMAFSFQPTPSDSPTTAAAHISHHHHGLLGYSPLVVLDHPTTTTSSSSSTTIPAAAAPPTLHRLHAPPPSLHPPRSSPPPLPWSCGEGDRERQRGKGAMTGNSAAAGNNNMGVGAVRMKKATAAGAGGGVMKAKGARRKVREPRFCFKTMSDVDVLDDGYKWRKYGQKVVKNTHHPRSYYRCTQDKCRVKKRVERLAEDPRMVITTYEGRHVHSPSRDDDDAARANAEMTFIW